MKYNKLVFRKNTKTVIITGTLQEIKMLAAKFLARPSVKVNWRILTSYTREEIYRLWIS